MAGPGSTTLQSSADATTFRLTKRLSEAATVLVSWRTLPSHRRVLAHGAQHAGIEERRLTKGADRDQATRRRMQQASPDDDAEAAAFHDTARGYEPSTRNSEARFLSAASALATCASSAWPTMSKKNT